MLCWELLDQLPAPVDINDAYDQSRVLSSFDSEIVPSYARVCDSCNKRRLLMVPRRVCSAGDTHDSGDSMTGFAKMTICEMQTCQRRYGHYRMTREW